MPIPRSPGRALPVDPGHPMARGLAAFLYAPGQRGLWDAVQRRYAQVTEGSPAVVATRQGRAWALRGNVRANLTVLNPLGKLTTEVTVLCCARVRSQPADNAQIFAYLDPANARGFSVAHSNLSAGMGWAYTSNNGFIFGNASGVADTKRFRTVGVQYVSGTTYQPFLDGVAQAPETAISGNVFGTPSILRFGRDPDFFDTYANVDILWAAAFNRLLTLGEHAWFARNPWRVLRTTRLPRTFFRSPVVLAYARPAADVTDGGWTNESGSNVDLYASIDETSPGDSDYIRSSLQGQGGSDTAEVALGPLTDPAGNTNHRVSYRYGKALGDGVGRVDLTVQLVQGTTVIASWTHLDIATGLTTAQQTLGAGQADAITDYTDLRLRFTAVGY